MEKELDSMSSSAPAAVHTSSQDRITMLITFNVKPEQKEVFKKVLIADGKGTAEEKGNVSIQLYEHSDKPHTFYIFSTWENQAAVDEHLTRSYTKDILELSQTALVSPMEILSLKDISF